MCKKKEEVFRVVICLGSILACSSYIPISSGHRCNQTSICMPLESCSQYWNEISKNGFTNDLITQLLQVNCGFVGMNPLVCCETTSRFGKKDIDRSEEAVNRGGHKNLKLLPTKCGEFNDLRIIAGKTADLNDLPWMVLLLYSQNGSRRLRHQCGGTLISDRYVLTAAHCISFERSNFLKSVVLGEYDISKEADCEPSGRYWEPKKCYYSKKMTISKKDTIVHQEYEKDDSRKLNDIALIRLPEPADLSLDNIKPICLPTTVELKHQKLEDVCGFVSGWGVIDKAFNSGNTSTVLKYATVPIISNQQCKKKFRGRDIHDSQLCTGVTDNVCRSVAVGYECRGDSGGPLVYTDKVTGSIRLVQWGIVSFSTAACAQGWPTVYTRVTHFMDWILDNIK